jgi:hypothetical protein
MSKNFSGRIIDCQLWREDLVGKRFRVMATDYKGNRWFHVKVCDIAEAESLVKCVLARNPACIDLEFWVETFPKFGSEADRERFDKTKGR